MRQRFRTWAGLAVLGLTSTVIASACSSDDKKDTEGDGNGQEGSIFKKLGITDPERHETIFADVKAPYTDVAGCKAFPSNVKEAHDCDCEKCFDIQQQCDALPGCIEIAECGIEIGCTDAYTCYLTPAAGKEKCVPIIDRWGNTGTAAALSLALSACSGTNNCRAAAN